MIALLTDFGLQDHYVGILHGVIKRFSPHAEIIDVTHGIKPQNVLEGMFRLVDSYQYFPDGTVFLAIVDPGVGSERDILLVESFSNYFVLPDNGLGTPFIRSAAAIFRLKREISFFDSTSTTFHGRDLFAPFAALVDLNRYQDLVSEVARPPVLLEEHPGFSGESIEGKIAYIDRYGNIVTNIGYEHLDPKEFSVRIGDLIIDKHHEYYSESTGDYLFCLKGSSNRLEIAARNGNASLKLTSISDNVIIIKK